MLAATPRLARHLRWRYHRECLRRGDTAWPSPAILTLNQWLQQCWEHSLLRGGAVGQRQLLNFPQSLRAIELAADSFPGEEPLNSSAAARRLLGQSWTLARNWGIGTRDLEAASQTPDTRFFAAWAVHFDQLCRERGWIDDASLAGQLLPEIADNSIPLDAAYVLAGFERATWSQQRLFAALDEHGCIAGRVGGGDGAGPVTAHRVDAPEAQTEYRWAAHWARRQLEARGDASVGVIVPNLQEHAAEFRRGFLDAFDPLWRERDGMEFPVGIDDGARLADAGLIQTALLVLRLPEGQIDYREIGQLLRSPYLAGGIDEGPQRAQLDLRIRDGQMQTVELHRMCRTGDDDGPQQFLETIGRILDSGEQTRGRREPAEWLPLIELLLKEAGFARGRELGHDEEQVLEAWTDLLEQFATLGEVVGEIPFGAVRRLLSDMAGDRPLHSNTRADGVQIMSPWDADGHHFDAVWLCGMTSEAWPPVARPSPLIPLSLQRDRGIPDAAPDVYRAQALATVDRLLGCAPEAIASWAVRAGETERVASPRIKALPAVEPGSSLFDASTVDFREALLRSTCTTTAYDEPPALASNERVRGGATLFNLQSACPARAFFELRLGAMELQSPPYALDARSRGKLAHDAAEHLYRTLKESGGLFTASDATLAEDIDAAVSFAIERHIPHHHPLAVALRGNEHHRLTHLLRSLLDKDRARGEFAIAGVEETHDIEVAGVPLRVRLDRIDRMPDGAMLVLDYKTGGYVSIEQTKGERPLQLQLPLYAAYGKADGIALYWLHADRLRIGATGADDFGILTTPHNRKYHLDEAQWAQQLTQWREILTGLLGEYTGGDCRIDLRQDRLAGGQFAMLTRRWELGSVAPEEDPA